MTNSKLPMSASYKAIFLLSIFIVFLVLIAGAATKSQSSGVGIWMWRLASLTPKKMDNT